jgi:glucosamine--fructose-6-phosphate aminotransferase (isomerizing)
MYLDREPYASFGLVKDMLSAVDVVRNFDPAAVDPIAKHLSSNGKLLLTGEGSSRLFPAKGVIAQARRKNWPLTIHTEAGRQAQEYDLGDWAVLAMSNSGRTAEVIRLYGQLNEAGHPRHFSLTAFPQSTLESLSTAGSVLKCGKEAAVAATKSVVEQGLFCRALVEKIVGVNSLPSRLSDLADQMKAALTQSIDPELSRKVSQAGTVYCAGRNDGVAEELTLKINEITRKHSDFLEGTYAVHGVEESMQSDDVIVWIEPYAESEQKFHDVLVKGVGLTVIAISARPTMFPTIQIPDAGDLAGFVQLVAGWNLLVEAGLQLGINIDKPERARKVGNEFTGK